MQPNTRPNNVEAVAIAAVEVEDKEADTALGEVEELIRSVSTATPMVSDSTQATTEAYGATIKTAASITPPQTTVGSKIIHTTMPVNRT